MTSVVTFDAGQTLVELDLDFLARRLGERGLAIAPSALEEAAPAAWRRYDAVIESGTGHAWKELVGTLLEGSSGAPQPDLVEWLWREQPVKNLWRRPIPEMIDLARDLTRRGVKVAVLSNSEGRLAELLEEIRIAEPFAAVVDSGRVGIEKPDPRIFAHALAALSAEDAVRRIHIGDSWPADIEGALGAGWQAVFYHPRAAGRRSDPRVAVARHARDVAAALTAWGV